MGSCLLESTKTSLRILLDALTPDNAMRLLTQLGKTALAQRKVLTLYANFELDEELEGRGHGRKSQGLLEQLSGSGGVGSIGTGTTNRETAAVSMLREGVAVWREHQRAQRVGHLLIPARELRAAGDNKRAGRMLKQAQQLADASLKNEVESATAVAEALITDGKGLDAAEESATLGGGANPNLTQTGAHVWGANVSDAMNGDVGTTPHPDEYASLAEKEDEDFGLVEGA